MARIKIHLPKQFTFSTQLKLRITDINYGGHLANDAVLGIAQEARLRYLVSMGYSEKDIEGKSLIMTDAAIMYKSQGYYGDPVEIKIAVDEISRLGFDLIYQVTNVETKKEIARVKTGLTFFDYQANKLAPVPENFKAKIQA
jgi:acyl-CoA thioester hydrolase